MNVSFDKVRAKLKELGAVCEQPMRLMRRVVMDTPDMSLHAEHSFLRIRDEGHKITITFKKIDKSKALHIASTKEVEIDVSSFEKAIELMEACGFVVLSLQESKRETWKLDSGEIVLDEWPWLRPLLEIEADEEKTVEDIALKLGFDWNDAAFGDIMTAYYAQYPHLRPGKLITSLSEVKFSDPLPEMLKK